MQLSSAPAKLTLPFANSGSKNTIPVPSQIGITAGAASYTDGFPPLTETDPSAGGVPPSLPDFNGILNEVSAPGVWYSAGGGFPYDAAFSASVGGYPQGARVMRSDGTGYWLSTVDNNTTNPEGSTPTGWVPDFTNGIAAVTMTSANVTLTPAQYGKPIIILTGVLTASLNLIFPSIVEDWSVVNNCTGAYTVTCKTAAGAGVAIPIGTTASIYSDGVNVYALYTYGTGTVTQIVAGTDITISPGGGTGVVTINGSNLAAPPPIGNTTPNTGAFTTPASSDNSQNAATTAWCLLGFAISLGMNGYIKLPTWLGGVIFQWATGTSFSGKTTGAQTIAWTITFPNACRVAWVSANQPTGTSFVGQEAWWQTSGWNQSGCNVQCQISTNDAGISGAWNGSTTPIAIGIGN